MAGPDVISILVAPDLAGVVRPAASVVDDVSVVEAEARLDGPLADATVSMRTKPEPVDTIAAVRAMYRRVGIDPTKTRPSSEALLRRVRKGGDLPRVNSLVDIINWCSLESQLPFGLYDRAAIEGPVTLRIGLEGEQYAGIRKDTVHVAGRLVLADALGPFGNPTSDSARTMVTTATTRALVVVFAPAGIAAAVTDEVLRVTRGRIADYC